MYNFLAVDVGYYLPSYEQVSIYFLKDVVSKQKKCRCTASFPLTVFFLGVKSKDVRHISVPQYEGLVLKDIAAFLNSGRQKVWDYMPDSQEIHKVSKDWICSVCATVLQGLFSG